jgi:hypothetical protein
MKVLQRSGIADHGRHRSRIPDLFKQFLFVLLECGDAEILQSLEEDHSRNTGQSRGPPLPDDTSFHFNQSGVVRDAECRGPCA